MLYTAMSRATQKAYVNFVDIYYNTYQGYIYKITSPQGMIYIGCTTSSVERRFDEHKKAAADSPLHVAMKEQPQGWTVEEVQVIHYVDEQELFIAETCHIMAHDSIQCGYNTKFSVDLLNLY